MNTLRKFMREFPNWVLNPVVIVVTLVVCAVVIVAYLAEQEHNQELHRQIQTCEKHNMFYLNGRCYPKDGH